MYAFDNSIANCEEVVNRRPVCIFARRRHLEKKNNKSFTICTVTNDAESNRLSSYTRPYSLTLLASKSSVSQRRGRDYPKETGISCQRSTERHSNGANTDYDTPTVTSQQYGIRAIFVSGDVRFQDGDNVDLSETGGGSTLSSVFYFFPPRSSLAYLALRYTPTGI